jgi:hypothetical protein
MGVTMSGGVLTQPCESCGGDHFTRDHDDAVAVERRYESADLPGPGPCHCHRSFASVAPVHHGHCCFLVPSTTCHPAEVAEWERQYALRHPEERIPLMTTPAASPLDFVRVSLSCGHTITAYRKDAGLPSLYCAGCRKVADVEGPAS